MWKVYKFKYVEEIHLHCKLLTKVDYMIYHRIGTFL